VFLAQIFVVHASFIQHPQLFTRNVQSIETNSYFYFHFCINRIKYGSFRRQ